MGNIRLAACGWVVLVSAACPGNGLSDAGDAGRDAGSPCGAAPSWTCVQGEIGGQCGDMNLQPECTGPTWSCPAPWFPSSQCACIGQPFLGCACTPAGYRCTDGGPDDGGSPTCSGEAPFSCVAGVAGGQCGDAVFQPYCDDDAGWSCPPGNVPTAQCACLGRPPGVCTCTASGWDCPVSDGGTGVDCLDNPPFFCVAGTAGGECGDGILLPTCGDAGWACPPNTVDTSECACIGRPPAGCTCTSTGWSCPHNDGGPGPVCDASAPFSCVAGTPGGQCSDALELPTCGDAGWACPPNTIDTSLCACLGMPAPGCTCTASGYACDGGSG